MLELRSMTIEEIEEALRERRSQGLYTVFFLGARAGEFYSSGEIYRALRRNIPIPPIPNFNSLTNIDKFKLCYELLSKQNEEEIYHILITALKNSKYRQEDEFLAGLMQEGFCTTIITTHIGTLVENAFIPASLKEHEDYEVIIPEIQGSSEIFRNKPKYGQIIRIFGDLESRKYRIAGREFDLEADRILKGFLESKLEKDILFIGYDPTWDQGIEQAFLPSGGMLWYINEEAPPRNSHLAYVLEQRGAKYLVGPRGNYRKFMRALYNGVTSQPTQPIVPLTRPTVPLPQLTVPLPQSTVRKKAFISYSHKDKRYLERFQVHLKGYLQGGSIAQNEKDFLCIWEDIWHDQKIKVGDLWQEEIRKALESTRVAILLVNADFLASDYIREHELPVLLSAAKAGEVKLLSVVLGPCNIKRTELYNYQIVNDISGSFMRMSRYEQELVWSNLAEQVFEILSTA